MSFSPVPKYRQWRIEKADWQSFQEIINFSQVNNLSNVNQINRRIASAIISAARKSIPITKENEPRRQIPWWSKECATTIKNKNRCLSKYIWHPTNENIIQFKKARPCTKSTSLYQKTKLANFCFQHLLYHSSSNGME